MNCFVTFIEYFGKLALCCPIGRVKSGSSWSTCLCVSRASIALWCILLITMYLKPCYDCAGLSGLNYPLSSRIAYYIMSLTMITSDLILRSPAVAYANDLVSLVATAKQQALVRSERSLRPFLVVLVGAAVGVLKFVGLVSISTKVHIIDGIAKRWEQTCFRSLIERLGYIVCDWSAAASLLFSVMFISVVGVILLGWFERWANGLKMSTQKKGNLQDASLAFTAEDVRDAPSNAIALEEFTHIRASFEAYSRVAGTYVLGLVISSTLNIINVLSVMVPGKESENLNFLVGGWHNNLYHLTFVPSLVLICVFGNYLSKKVS